MSIEDLYRNAAAPYVHSNYRNFIYVTKNFVSNDNNGTKRVGKNDAVKKQLSLLKNLSKNLKAQAESFLGTPLGGNQNGAIQEATKIISEFYTGTNNNELKAYIEAAWRTLGSKAFKSQFEKHLENDVFKFYYDSKKIEAKEKKPKDFTPIDFRKKNKEKDKKFIKAQNKFLFETIKNAFYNDSEIQKLIESAGEEAIIEIIEAMNQSTKIKKAANFIGILTDRTLKDKTGKTIREKIIKILQDVVNKKNKQLNKKQLKQIEKMPVLESASNVSGVKGVKGLFGYIRRSIVDFSQNFFTSTFISVFEQELKKEPNKNLKLGINSPIAKDIIKQLTTEYGNYFKVRVDQSNADSETEGTNTATTSNLKGTFADEDFTVVGEYGRSTQGEERITVSIGKKQSTENIGYVKDKDENFKTEEKEMIKKLKKINDASLENLKKFVSNELKDKEGKIISYSTEGFLQRHSIKQLNAQNYADQYLTNPNNKKRVFIQVKNYTLYDVENYTDIDPNDANFVFEVSPYSNKIWLGSATKSKDSVFQNIYATSTKIINQMCYLIANKIWFENQGDIKGVTVNLQGINRLINFYLSGMAINVIGIFQNANAEDIQEINSLLSHFNVVFYLLGGRQHIYVPTYIIIENIIHVFEDLGKKDVSNTDILQSILEYKGDTLLNKKEFYDTKEEVTEFQRFEKATYTDDNLVKYGQQMGRTIISNTNVSFKLRFTFTQDEDLLSITNLVTP